MAEEVGGAERGAEEVQEGRNECRNARRHPVDKGRQGEARRSPWSGHRGC
jgi:hypothetical protein